MNILLVGGTGSFGQAYLNHLQQTGFSGRIRVFSRDEDKQLHLKQAYPDLNLETMIGDIRDFESYSRATRQMEVVIHAAALKHVPVGELFTEEVVRTNTLGTLNCVRACQENGVRKAIFLSTDKAVYPINAYGMSKALGEKIFQSKYSQDADTTFCITRYGNVLGSRGSILPVLAQRVAQNRPLLLTDLSMTRFVMNLQQAVALVNYALQFGADGQIFVQEVPAADLKTLTEGWLQLAYGYSLADYPYEIIGIRPGEKIHEALATEEELTRATRLPGNLLRIDSYLQQELNHERRQALTSVHPEALTSDRVQRLDLEGVKRALQEAGLHRDFRQTFPLDRGVRVWDP